MAGGGRAGREWCGCMASRQQGGEGGVQAGDGKAVSRPGEGEGEGEGRLYGRN